MGSLYEAVQLVSMTSISMMLRDSPARRADDMRGRHTNLE